MRLIGPQFEDLSEALRDAFTHQRLGRMLYTRLGKRLEDISLGGDFQQVTFDLLRDAEMTNYVAQLVTAARQSNPGNERLLAAAQRLGLAAGTAELEKRVRDLPFVDVAGWRTRLGEVENQVCKIETGGASGTGFLVAPGVVLTNYHVIEGAIKTPSLASGVVLRFDYKRTPDGTTVCPGTVFRLPSKDWLIDCSRYSTADLRDDPSACPSAEELDYALIRVDGDPGSLPVNHPTAEPGAPLRGFVTVTGSAADLRKDAPLMIVQHPEGEPLKLALDTQAITQVNANRTRVRYRTNTEPGSSGSPCFDLKWRLVALHHCGDPTAQPTALARWNQGIPMDAIVALITKRGFGGSLGGGKPGETPEMPTLPGGTENTTRSGRPLQDKGGGRMSEDASRVYLTKVGNLKGLLVDRSRNGTSSEKEYASLRSELVAIPVIRDALPTIVLKCRTIQEFWTFIKPKFSTWKERTEFLQQEFDPLLTALEQGEAPVGQRVPAAAGRPPAPRPDVLLVTVNEHETRAVRDEFEAATGAPATTVPLDGRVYRNLGTVNGTTVYHALSEMGSGSVGAMQQTVDKAIRALDPGAVIAVGVAFGVNEKKQAIGDILLSRQLRPYDLQRVGSEIVLRGDKPHATPRLIDHFHGFAQTTWEGAKVRPGVVLTGEKLIDEIDYRDALLAIEGEAVGGEMEGAGLYVPCYEHKVDWVVLKAICDWADGNKARNKTARQKKAAKNAVQFLVRSLQNAPLMRQR